MIRDYSFYSWFHFFYQVSIMMEKCLYGRRYQKSLRCLIAAISCAVASLLGGYLWLLRMPENVGWKGLEDIVWVICWVLVGLAVAAGVALASLVYGILCAREWKRVLFWVVPLWLCAACGLITGVIQLILWIDETLLFIPGGKRDDVASLLAIWLGGSGLLSLSYWITGVVYELRFRLFPWWSAPLWAGALAGVIFLLG